MDVQKTIEKIMELVKKGNVSRIIIRRKGNTVLDIPVTFGVVGAAVGLAAAKWALLAGVLATVGFGCTVEIQKADGATVNVLDDENNRKIHELAADTVEKVKEAIPVSISVDIQKDDDSPLDAEFHDSEDDDRT